MSLQDQNLIFVSIGISITIRIRIIFEAFADRIIIRTLTSFQERNPWPDQNPRQRLTNLLNMVKKETV